MMLTRAVFNRYAKNFMEWCEYDAARYKTLYTLLDMPYDNPHLTALRPAFMKSDIVLELYEAQRYDGSWGPLSSKDYAAKDKFPTTMVAAERCLYIGCSVEDGDMLLSLLDYLEDILRGYSEVDNTSPVRLYNKNERAIPWQLCDIAAMIERMKPYNPLCDRLWGEWFYIAGRAFEDGAYSHERDKLAQHEVLGTREDRLVPLPVTFLVNRRADMPPELERAMLDHYGGYAYRHGHFWDKPLDRLPAEFVNPYTRRYFHTIKYINQFRGSAPYLSDTVDWLLSQVNADGLWDYGTQVKDPWGYFGYFSCNRQYKYNKIVDCTMEVLDVLKRYLNNNADNNE